MSQVLPTGHRRRGSGFSTDSMQDFERALILVRHKGKDVYVDSAAAAGGNGDSWSGAYTSLANYITAGSVANDRVHVAPGHTETIAAVGGITLAVAGVSIRGYGRGTKRPTITMSAVASSLKVTGASVEISNILFLSIAACTIVLDIDATDCLIDTCEFRRTSGTVPALWIDVGTGGSANGCDRLEIRDCKMDTGTNVGATGFVELGAIANNVVIDGCVVFGDFGDACIHNPTGFVLTNLQISRCILTNLQTGDHSIELVSACTGNLIENYYHTDLAQQTGVDPGSCFSFECYQDDVIDTGAILTPVIT